MLKKEAGNLVWQENTHLAYIGNLILSLTAFVFLEESHNDCDFIIIVRERGIDNHSPQKAFLRFA